MSRLPLDGDAHARLRTFAVDTAQLAEILRDRQRPECVAAFTNALRLYARLDERHGEAVTALNLARVYHDMPGLSDIGEAKTWYLRSLALCDANDQIGRAMCLGNLGQLAMEYTDAGASQRDAKGNSTILAGRCRALPHRSAESLSRSCSARPCHRPQRARSVVVVVERAS